MSKFIFPSIQLFSIHMRLSTTAIMVVRVYERGPKVSGLIPYSMDVSMKTMTHNGSIHEEFIFTQIHGDIDHEFEGDIEGQKRWVLEHIIGQNTQEYCPEWHELSFAQQVFLNDYAEMIHRRAQSFRPFSLPCSK